MRQILAAALWMALPGAGWAQAESLPYTLQRQAPAFGDALIAAIQQWNPARDSAPGLDHCEGQRLPIPRTGAAEPQSGVRTASSETLARLYVKQALSNPETLAEACAFLDARDDAGRQAKARLMELATPSRDARQASVRAQSVSARLNALQGVKWDENVSRGTFDGGSAQGGVAAVVAGARSTPPLAPAKAPPQAAPVKEEKPDKQDASIVRLVSISVEKLQELAVNKDPKERKLQLEKPFGLGVTPISGAGVFTSKVLSEEDIQADPAKQAAAAEAAKKGQPVDFVRTNSKIQLMGTFVLPVDIPGNPGEANLGLRKGGVVEIVETRSVAHGTDSHPDHKTFLWPLTAQHLREVMKPGEDITVTGRIEGSGALVGGIGQGIDFPYYGSVNGKLEAGVGGAKDKWISLHIKKIDADHVRIFLEKGDGKAFRAHVEASAGLDLNSDDFIPHVPPSTMEETMLGKAVILGEDSTFRKIEDLGKVELTGEFTRSKHDLQTEGWGSVSVSDPKTAGALDDFFNAHPGALRSLPADATVDQSLGAGRFNAEVREVANQTELEAHLSFLHITRSSGNKHFEVRWRQDSGVIAHYLIVIGEKEFEENINNTSRSQESAMWYDLNTGEASISVKLGPQDRLLTTTREHINEVIALQKALGLELETAKINEPHPYLQFFGLGNYGRSSESGQFVLGNEGIQALKKAEPEALLIAYLRADWLFEKESYAPGSSMASESSAPPWAAIGSPAALKPALDFLRRHASEAMRSDGRGQAGNDASYQYNRVAPGRWLRGDAWRFLAAQEYADRVVKMQRAGNDPGHLLNLFLKFRRDRIIELKRSVVATASLAGRHKEEEREVPNFAGYIEMTGKRVTLKPKMKSIELPDSPVDKVQDIVKQWQ